MISDKISESTPFNYHSWTIYANRLPAAPSCDGCRVKSYLARIVGKGSHKEMYASAGGRLLKRCCQFCLQFGKKITSNVVSQRGTKRKLKKATFFFKSRASSLSLLWLSVIQHDRGQKQGTDKQPRANGDGVGGSSSSANLCLGGQKHMGCEVLKLNLTLQN